MYENDLSNDTMVILDDTYQAWTYPHLTQNTQGATLCSNGSVVDRFWVNPGTVELHHPRGTLGP